MYAVLPYYPLILDTRKVSEQAPTFFTPSVNLHLLTSVPLFVSSLPPTCLASSPSPGQQRTASMTLDIYDRLPVMTNSNRVVMVRVRYV
jgi:hypothetical protein